jgi:hypothetical protein
MAESGQSTSHIDPVKALELLNGFSQHRSNLRDIGDDESAQMIEELVRRKEIFQQYVILLKVGLLTNEEFMRKIRTLVGAEV